MPLTLEAEIANAQSMRQDDERFIAKFGEKKWQEKLESEGSIAYRYLNEVYRDIGLDLAEILSEEFFHGGNQTLKEKYLGRRRQWFSYHFWGQAGGRGEVIDFEKPFPKQEFEARMRAEVIPYGIVANYRAAELTEQEIRRAGGGTFDGYRYLDLSEVLRPLKKPELEGGQLEFNFFEDSNNQSPRVLSEKDAKIIDALGELVAKQKNSNFPDLIVGPKVLSADDLMIEIITGTRIGRKQLELINQSIEKRSHMSFDWFIKHLKKGSRF